MDEEEKFVYYVNILLVFGLQQEKQNFRRGLFKLENCFFNNLYMYQWCLDNQPEVHMLTESYQSFTQSLDNVPGITEDMHLVSQAKNSFVSNFVSSVGQSYLNPKAMERIENFISGEILPNKATLIKKIPPHPF